MDSKQREEQHEGESQQPAVERNLTQSVTSGTSNDAMERNGLPRLDYNLWDYRKKLFFISSLLVAEMSLLPVALFYGLWYGTTLRHGICTSFLPLPSLHPPLYPPQLPPLIGSYFLNVIL